MVEATTAVPGGNLTRGAEGEGGAKKKRGGGDRYRGRGGATGDSP
eukprot:COSAG05_NODE_2262_length_3318_cov_4.455421_3_plen_45_part_00